MHDAVLDKDVLQDQTRPRLRIELGKKSLSNRAIIETGRLGNIARCESLQQIAARDYADEPAILDDWDAFDSMAFECLCDFGKRSRRRYGDDFRGHDVLR